MTERTSELSRPTARFQAFAASIDAGDFDGAKAQCSAMGLEDRGVGIGRLLRQAEHEGLIILPFAELQQDARAACNVTLATRSPKRLHGNIWLTASHTQRWEMIGAVQTEREAALFLSGVIPALWSREHLEHCEKAEAWGHERLKDWPSRCGFDDALRDQLLELSSDHRHGLACIGGYVLTPLNLWAVGIGATEQDGFICRQRWLSLHDLGPGNEPELLGIAPSPKQALLIKPPSR